MASHIFFIDSEMQSKHRPMDDYTSAPHTEEIPDLMWNDINWNVESANVRSHAPFTGAGQCGTRMGFPTRPKVGKKTI